MCVLAHPDDESLGTGGVLAKYGGEGVATYVVSATRGERGRFDDSGRSPGPEVVGRAREAELRAAADVLGVHEVILLDYHDGALDEAPAGQAAEAIAVHIRRIKPHVVVTFDPYGAYGHRDHIAISQLTTAAIVRAADTHRVTKFYYFVTGAEKWAAYQAAFKTMTSKVDGTVREATAWPDWAITTVVDTAAHWPTVWRAVQCHESQVAIYGPLAHLGEAEHRRLWGTQGFYRAMSLVNGGRDRESDLFEGFEG